MSKPDLQPAIRAARHFVLVANGYARGQNSRAAMEREVSALCAALRGLRLGDVDTHVDDAAITHGNGAQQRSAVG
jgi:hypothetical protein